MELEEFQGRYLKALDDVIKERANGNFTTLVNLGREYGDLSAIYYDSIKHDAGAVTEADLSRCIADTLESYLLIKEEREYAVHMAKRRVEGE